MAAHCCDSSTTSPWARPKPSATIRKLHASKSSSTASWPAANIGCRAARCCSFTPKCRRRTRDAVLARHWCAPHWSMRRPPGCACGPAVPLSAPIWHAIQSSTACCDRARDCSRFALRSPAASALREPLIDRRKARISPRRQAHRSQPLSQVIDLELFFRYLPRYLRMVLAYDHLVTYLAVADRFSGGAERDSRLSPPPPPWWFRPGLSAGPFFMPVAVRLPRGIDGTPSAASGHMFTTRKTLAAGVGAPAARPTVLLAMTTRRTK